LPESNVDEVVDLVISNVVYPGRGIARLDNFVVFVPGTIAGEHVRARITAHRRNFAEGRLLDVIQSAPSRIEPECPLALKALSGMHAGDTVCPGCSYQHMGYEEELCLKDAQLSDLIERLGGGPPEGEHMEPVAAPEPYHYRNKIVLHLSAREEARVLGYVGEDNRTVIPISCCPLARPEINERLRTLLEDPTFVEHLEDHTDVTLRFTEANGIHYWSTNRPEAKRWLTESTGVGDIRVAASGFFQVNSAVANRLLETVKEHIGRIQPAAVVDLYCGAGVFSIAAAELGIPAVLGIDLDKRAIKAADYNAHSRGLSQIDFLAAPAAEIMEEALEPIDREHSLLIVDPPRRGLEKNVSRMIAERGPGRLLYISCAPDTLARDLKILRNAGYTIESRRVFDMFPRTPHFESLVVLSR